MSRNTREHFKSRSHQDSSNQSRRNEVDRDFRHNRNRSLESENNRGRNTEERGRNYKHHRSDDQRNYYQDTYNWTATPYRREPSPKRFHRPDYNQNENGSIYREVRREINVYHKCEQYIYENREFSRNDNPNRDNPPDFTRAGQSEYSNQRDYRRPSRWDKKSPIKSKVRVETESKGVSTESEENQNIIYNPNRELQTQQKFDKKNLLYGRFVSGESSSNNRDSGYNQSDIDKSTDRNYQSDSIKGKNIPQTQSRNVSTFENNQFQENLTDERNFAAAAVDEGTLKNIIERDTNLVVPTENNNIIPQLVPHFQTNSQDDKIDQYSKPRAEVLGSTTRHEKSHQTENTLVSREDTTQNINISVQMSLENNIFEGSSNVQDMSIDDSSGSDQEISCPLDQNQTSQENVVGDNLKQNREEIAETFTNLLDKSTESEINNKKQKRNRKSHKEVSSKIIKKIVPARKGLEVKKAIIVDNGYKFLIKSAMTNKTSFLTWLKKHEELTGVTYENKTGHKPPGGKINFKGVFQCVELLDKLPDCRRRKRCRSKITIEILSKTWIAKSDKVNKSKLLVQPTTITLLFTHNHDMNLRRINAKPTENEILPVCDDIIVVEQPVKSPEIIDIAEDESLSERDLLIDKIEKIQEARMSEIKIQATRVGEENVEISILFLPTVKKFTKDCPVLFRRVDVVKDFDVVVLSVEFSVSKLPLAILLSSQRADMSTVNDLDYFKLVGKLLSVENVEGVDDLSSQTVMPTVIYRKIEKIWSTLTSQVSNFDLITAISQIIDDVDNVDTVCAMMLNDLVWLTGCTGDIDSFLNFLLDNSMENFEFLEDFEGKISFVELNEHFYCVKDEIDGGSEYFIHKKFGFCNCARALLNQYCEHRTALFVRKFRQMNEDVKLIPIPGSKGFKPTDDDVRYATDILKKLRQSGPSVRNKESEKKRASNVNVPDKYETRKKLDLFTDSLMNKWNDENCNEIAESVDIFVENFLELKEHEICAFLKKQ